MEVNANIESLQTKIIPKSLGAWESVKSDLFFDQGQIVMEISNLQFFGNGMVVDPDTGVKERIDLIVDMDLCQIVMNLEVDKREDGNVYPMIKIDDVAFTLDAKSFHMQAEGDLPLYKAH